MFIALTTDPQGEALSALYHVNPETFSFVDIGNMVAAPFTELAHGRLPSGGLAQIAGPHERHRIHTAPRPPQYTQNIQE